MKMLQDVTDWFKAEILGDQSLQQERKKLKSQKASFLITLIHDLGSFIGKFVKNTNTWRNQTGH